LALSAREAVIDLADNLDIAIVEDAAYQTLRYDGEAISPILALEIARKGSIEHCRTLYCGSFSKSLAPGLRVGWVCGAKEVISRLVLMKQAADLHSSTVNQIVTDRVARRIFDTHIARLRATYKARRDHLLTALAREMPPGVEWTKPEGGMFVWLTLPPTMDGAELLAKSLQTERVAFVPGRAFFADGSNGNTIRLSFSCANEAAIDEGMLRLGRLIRQQ
jgi:DNA-binding transcriptional MocR family regulator